MNHTYCLFSASWIILDDAFLDSIIQPVGKLALEEMIYSKVGIDNKVRDMFY